MDKDSEVKVEVPATEARINTRLLIAVGASIIAVIGGVAFTSLRKPKLEVEITPDPIPETV